MDKLDDYVTGSISKQYKGYIHNFARHNININNFKYDGGSIYKYKLMLKTHTETNIHYLCVTIKDKWKLYKGSGHRWTSLIKKYPSEIVTDLLYTTDDLDKFNCACVSYSILFDIPYNQYAFANLMIEYGYSNELAKYHREKEKFNTISKRPIARNTTDDISDEKLESRARKYETRKSTNMKNWGVENVSQLEYIKEMKRSSTKATIESKGVFNCQFCSKEFTCAKIERHEKSCKSNTNAIQEYRPRKECTYCNRLIATCGYEKYHGENCKFNPINIGKKYTINGIKCEHCGVICSKETLENNHGENCKFFKNNKKEDNND